MSEKLIYSLTPEQLTVMKEIYERSVIRYEAGGCWDWKGSRDGKGYGKIRIPGQGHKGNHYIRAHRFSFEIHKRALREGELVLHSCDNPPCTKPGHIRAGTHKDNSDDSVNRGRHTHGALSPHAQITEKQAKQIRALLLEGEFKSDIAKEVGCEYQIVDRIANWETWRHLGPKIKYKKKPASECRLRKKWKEYKTAPSKTVQRKD